MEEETEAAERRQAMARSQWAFPAGVNYLNHGSFGPTPRLVLEERERLLRDHAANPMDFFLRKMEPLLDQTAAHLARFVNCPPENLIFVSNSTAAMNIVAANVKLETDDEVLLTDHEYGAVIRIWGQACRKVGARTVLAHLPLPLKSADEVVESIFEKVNAKTKLLIVSHITSPTAAILPVRQICERAKQQGLMVCIDGPHALAMIDLDLNSIPCDFYAASCHKWLSGPLGSGFLYVRSRHRQGLKPNIISWGRSVMGRPASWKDEFHWPGTFDPTPFLAIPTAIRLLQEYGISKFRTETHSLCQFARQRLLTIPGSGALTIDDPAWYGSMVTIRLPVEEHQGSPNERHPLQNWLWDHSKIEIPIVRWRDETHIRASCHLYNSREQYEQLLAAVTEWMKEQPAPHAAES